MHIAIASYETMIVLLLHLLLQLLFIVRVMLRPHRQPASRIAWVVVIFALPIAGMLLYIFFGEMNIGRKRVARLRDVVKQMPDFPEVLPQDKHNLAVNTPLKYQPLFCVGQSINQSFWAYGEITLIGSANMDRRSFALNYENNILLYDPELSAELRQRQQEYISHSHPVTLHEVSAWPMSRRLINNTIAMLGPLFWCRAK